MTMTDTKDEASVSSGEPFHFITNLSSDGEVEAAVPTMWCVQSSVTEELASRDIGTAWLLISVLNVVHGNFGSRMEYRETNRYLVPLTQRMEYIRFSRPGLNIVIGTIVWAAGDETENDIRRLFLKKKEGEYVVSVAREDSPAFQTKTYYRHDDFKKKNIYASMHEHCTSFEVIVPSNLFGKPSPAFEKLWFAKFFRTKMVDECHRRKRRALWLFFPIWLVFRTLFGGLLYAATKFLGYRKSKFKPLIHPLKEDLAGMVAEVRPKHDPLRWFMTKDKHWKSPPLLLLNPLSITAVWGVIAFLANLTYGIKSHKDYGQHYLFSMRWYESLAWSVGIHLALAIAAIAILVGIMAVSLVIGWILPKEKAEERYRKKMARQAKRRNRSAENQKRKKEERISRLRGELQEMSCDAVPDTVSIGALPVRKRSFHLFLQAGKQRVCKSFAAD